MNHQLIQRFCDFQVHSPRDPSYKEWQEDLMTLDGLYTWAMRLLDECRKRGVHAVAVTDHHDLLAGLIALEVSRRESVTDIWVFPGMEITSKSGIQAILILDPSVVGAGSFQTKDKLGIQDQIKTALGQSISAQANPGRALQTPNWDELQKLDGVDPQERAAIFRIPKTERVDRELDGEDQISDNLERIFPDKFLLLPNLERNKQGVFGNESGRSFYMGGGGWFVGGIISGGQKTDFDAICGKKSQDYGTRVVTCIRSSDQRGKDAKEWFSDYFGSPENGSWLKLSEPTTVSITQALISGMERRVFQKEVVTPADRIERFWIKGAQIFRDNSIDIDLTSHMNSFIGGRGSGKSLILSAMVRLFGADHDWIVRKRDEGAELPAWEERHMSLFAKDGPFSLPEVEFGAEYRKSPGVRYRVVLMSPNLGSNCKYKLSVFTDGEWKVISDAVEIPDRLDFRPLVFLQGQMSALTGGNVDQDDLRKLIEGPIREERAKLRADLEILATRAKDGIDNSIRLRTLTAQFDSLQIQLKQKEEERKRFLAVAEAGLKEDERKLFVLADDPLRDVIRNTKSLEDQLQSLIRDLDSQAAETESKLALARTAVDKLATQGAGDITGHVYIERILRGSGEIKDNIIALKKHATDLHAELSISHAGFKAKTDELLGKAKALGEKEQGRKEATLSAESLHVVITQLKDQSEKVSKERNRIEKSELIEAGKAALQEYKSVVKNYSERLFQRATEISNDTQLKLFVRIVPGGRYANFIDEMRKICEGAGVRGTTWAKMEEVFKESKSPVAVMTDLLQTMFEVLREPEKETYPQIWNDCGFSEAIFKNIVSRTTTESWAGLSVILAEDRVDVRYKIDGGKPIPILQASPGERAVELLKLALRSTTGPLIIDQPEDDLDNSFLAEKLVSLVHDAKPRNQLIFVSHNANLVVHGDSDIIHVLDATSGEGDTGKCQRRLTGTIDQQQTCLEVERIMEGGRRAFEGRRRKYHETVNPAIDV